MSFGLTPCVEREERRRKGTSVDAIGFRLLRVFVKRRLPDLAAESKVVLLLLLEAPEGVAATIEEEILWPSLSSSLPSWTVLSSFLHLVAVVAGVGSVAVGCLVALCSLCCRRLFLSTPARVCCFICFSLWSPSLSTHGFCAAERGCWQNLGL